MNESISRAAGTEHGQEFPPEAMEELIRSLGRTPEQRTTLYGPVPAERRAASLNAAVSGSCRHDAAPETGRGGVGVSSERAKCGL